MRRTAVIVALTVAGVLVVSGVALAWGRGGGMWFPADLSEEQRAEMKQLWEAWREETAPIREQLREKMQQLRTARQRVEESDPELKALLSELREKMQQLRTARQRAEENDPELKALLAEVERLQEELRGKCQAFREKMLAPLTPEQREGLRCWPGPGGRRGFRPGGKGLFWGEKAGSDS